MTMRWTLLVAGLLALCFASPAAAENIALIDQTGRH
jgi:hypothetical protein